MNTTSLFVVDGFEDYTVETTPTPTAFIAFCSVFVGVAFCFVLTLVACGQRYTKAPVEEPIENGVTTLLADSGAVQTGVSEQAAPPEQEMVTLENGTSRNTNADTSDGGVPNMNGVSNDASHENQESPEPMERVSPQPIQEGTAVAPLGGSFPETFTSPTAMDQASAVNSAATTSRLHEANIPAATNRKRARNGWDAAAKRWKQRRPVGRLEARARSSRSERHSQVSGEDESMGSRSRASWNSRTGSRVSSRRGGMSDLANTVLEREVIEGEAEYYRQRYVQRSSRRRRGSAAWSERSGLPPLSPDALSPEDAADAHDPGTVPVFDGPEEEEEHSAPTGALCCCLGKILDLAEPDFESKRILISAFPTTISAISEPLFRLVLVAIISHFINTDSMVAFVLVILFVRITMEELSAAITDTESTMVQNAFAQGGDAGFYYVGQHVQLAIFMQLLIGVPVLAVWAYVMDDMVLWLVDSENIASIAAGYTRIIVIDYIVQASCRTFMLVFHLTGNGKFETNIDLCATLLLILVIAIIVGLNDSVSLDTIGWIQVGVGAAKAVMKIVYVVVKGWVQPYKRGLLGRLSLTDWQAVRTFLSLSLPLFMGSLIELREWELLTLFVRYLGAAEVASWAIMGIVWEVFEASTEGLGDAAAMRVSFFLVEGLPVEAKLISNKVIFIAAIEALCVTSIFLMAGPNIAVWLTIDSTLENLFNDLVGMTGLANIALTFAQVYWSLVGAQGRFGLASSTILGCRWLITMPLALSFVYASFYDLRAIAGSVAVGYATASAFLAHSVSQSDWEKLSLEAQALDDPSLGDDFPDFSVDEGEEESSSEDDSIIMT